MGESLADLHPIQFVVVVVVVHFKIVKLELLVRHLVLGLVDNVIQVLLDVSGNRERERNVLFNDALNTFDLRLYGVRHTVKDHSDSERGNLLRPHGLLFSINSKGSFICTIPHTG